MLRSSLRSCEPFTCSAWSLWAHQQSDQCSTWLSSETFYGKSFQGKFSASMATMRLNIFCQGTEGIYLQAIRHTHAGLQTSPTGIYTCSECCSGTRGCANTQSKGSLGPAWDCHICSRKYSQGRGCLRVKVSAKVRTGWRRFQFQDLTLLLLHLIMQCLVAAISLSSIYYYISLLHKKSLIRR